MTKQVAVPIAVLVVAGAATVATAIWFFKDVYPRDRSIALGSFMAALGIAQIVAALHPARPLLFVGRWASLVLGATLSGLFIGAVVAGGSDIFLPGPAARMPLMLAFALLHFVAAGATRKMGSAKLQAAGRSKLPCPN